MRYLGDHIAGIPVTFTFNTVTSGGAPVTLTSGAVAVYKGTGTTETTVGVTLTTDFDGRTGLHLVNIATSDSFYAAGSSYHVVLTAGTADSVSVAGRTIALFSIQNRAPGGSTNISPASVQSYATGQDPGSRALADLAPIFAAGGQTAGSDGMTIAPVSGVDATYIGGTVYTLDTNGDSTATYPITNVIVGSGILIPGLPSPYTAALRFMRPASPLTGNTVGTVAGTQDVRGTTAPTGTAFATLTTNAATAATQAALANTNAATASTNAATASTQATSAAQSGTTLVGRVTGVLPTTSNFTSGALVPAGAFFTNSPAADGALTSEQAAALQATADKVALLQVGRVINGGPVAQGGNLTIFAGDDYSSTTGNLLTWTVTGYTTSAPSSVELGLIDSEAYASGSTTADLEVAGTSSLSGTTLTVTVPVTAAQTAALDVAEPNAASGNYRYQLVGLYSGSTRRTLASGLATVVRRIAT